MQETRENQRMHVLQSMVDIYNTYYHPVCFMTPMSFFFNSTCLKNGTYDLRYPCMYPNKAHLHVHKNLITGHVKVTGPKSSHAAKQMPKKQMRGCRICTNKQSRSEILQYVGLI